jgi:hypothetical protein
VYLQHWPVSGTVLREAELEAGNLECGMIGESTFLTVVDEGLPWSAVSRLGQDTRESAGKIVVVRSDLPIEGPADLRGLTFGSRESGPYDQVMVREFLLSRGVDPSSMVILDQVPPDDLERMLEDRELDLAFLHLVIAATIRRVRHEQSLPARERSRFSGSRSFGMDLTFFEDFDIPQYSERPLIQVDLLAEMQRLLLKQGSSSEDGPDRCPTIRAPGPASSPSGGP